MAEFLTAYTRTLGHEGGYVNDPNDRGGETYKGIARNYHPDWDGWDVIDKLKDEPDFPNCLANHDSLQRMVRRFYKVNFWDIAELDEMARQDLANELFDTAVNQGMATAIEYLQASLNMLNRNEQDYQDIAVDGKWGNETRKAYQQFIGTASWRSRNAEKCVKTLIKLMNALQAERYMNIIRNDASQAKYLFGWFNRI